MHVVFKFPLLFTICAYCARSNFSGTIARVVQKYSYTHQKIGKSLNFSNMGLKIFCDKRVTMWIGSKFDSEKNTKKPRQDGKGLDGPPIFFFLTFFHFKCLYSPLCISHALFLPAEYFLDISQRPPKKETPVEKLAGV